MQKFGDSAFGTNNQKEIKQWAQKSPEPALKVLVEAKFSVAGAKLLVCGKLHCGWLHKRVLVLQVILMPSLRSGRER